MISPVYNALAYLFGMVALFSAGAFSGWYVESTRWNEAVSSQEKAASAVAAAQSISSETVESQYVQDLARINAPGVDIAAHLRADCLHVAQPERVRKPIARRIPVPAGDASQPPNAVAAASADDGVLGHIAEEIPSCVQNARQLSDLQALVLANSSHRP